jgi:hypothetical protein
MKKIRILTTMERRSQKKGPERMAAPPCARGTCLGMGASVVDHPVSHQTPICLGEAGAVYPGTAAINRKLGQIELGKKPQARLGAHNAAVSKPDGLARHGYSVDHACPTPVHVHVPHGSVVVDGPHHVSLGTEGVHAGPLGLLVPCMMAWWWLSSLVRLQGTESCMGQACEVLLGCSIHVFVCHGAMGGCMAGVLAKQAPPLCRMGGRKNHGMIWLTRLTQHIHCACWVQL